MKIKYLLFDYNNLMHLGVFVNSVLLFLFLVEMPIEEEDNRPNVKKYETSHSKTTIVYRENFVPYSTRLLNLFRSTNESSPEGQNHEEQK